MSAEMDEFWNQVRRIAQEVVGRSQYKGTLVCTAYNPKTHAVKGIIQPHGIESGWVPIAAMHAGNGYGVLVGPRVGDPQKLDGQVFDIHFDGGDPDTLVAHHRQFSTPETPPQVQSGEILVMQEGGSKVFMDQTKQVTVTHGPSGNTMVFAQDKSITITHKDSGSSIQIDKDGNQVHDPKGQSHIFKGQATFQQAVSMQQTLSVADAATLGSGSTTGGLPIKTGS